MAATTVEGKIATALLDHLNALSLSPALPVAWPDVKFTPPSSGMWLEAALFETPTQALALAETGKNEYRGFLQVNVVSPENVGVIKSRDVAGQVISHFKRGTKLSEGGIQIEIVEPPYIAPVYRDPPYSRTPVTIRYRVFARQT